MYFVQIHYSHFYFFWHKQNLFFGNFSFVITAKISEKQHHRKRKLLKSEIRKSTKVTRKASYNFYVSSSLRRFSRMDETFLLRVKLFYCTGRPFHSMFFIILLHIHILIMQLCKLLCQINKLILRKSNASSKWWQLVRQYRKFNLLCQFYTSICCHCVA